MRVYRWFLVFWLLSRGFRLIFHHCCFSVLSAYIFVCEKWCLNNNNGNSNKCCRYLSFHTSEVFVFANRRGLCDKLGVHPVQCLSFRNCNASTRFLHAGYTAIISHATFRFGETRPWPQYESPCATRRPLTETRCIHFGSNIHRQ